MPTALTGSMGWSGLYPVQLGGPPLTNTWSRPLPTSAKPLVAHVYNNDGVTFKGTFSILSWTGTKATTTNGGYDQVTLNLATTSQESFYGQSTYGSSIYGGLLEQGNVIRITEQGGPWPGFIFSGTIEDVPDTIGSTQVTHSVLLTHFGFELNDVFSQSLYTVPTDLSQIVRDAVAQTFHCSCDQVSVPISTGIYAPVVGSAGGSLDFRNQTVQQQIDTCRAIAGSTWYWYVDELGRVWFQFMGSSPVYTLMRGPSYSDRTSSNSIANRKNQVVVVGGVPTGGSQNAQAIYNGASQAVIGIRSLFPNLTVPNITDQATLTSIANNVGAVTDRVWRQATLKVHAPFAQRIHGSQPGGPMIRYFEPLVNPLPESESGLGIYSGPFIVNSVQWDMINQTVVVGDLPIISQSDLQNMINNLVNTGSSNSLFVAPAALNKTQTLTGTFQSGLGTEAIGVLGSVPGSMWSLTQQMFQAIDPNGIPRFQAGNLPANGISPAQWGARINGADGVTLFDGIGAVGLPKRLAEVIQTSAVQGTNTSFADVSGGVTPTFTLSRQANVLVMAMGRVAAQPVNSLDVVFLGLRCGSDTTTGSPQETDATIASLTFVPFCMFFWDTLAAGSYTAALQANAQGGAGAQWNVAYLDVIVFQFGG